MSRILIAGYYGFGNCGDEAILGGMLHDLRALEPQAEFVVVTGDPAATRETHTVEAVAWTDLAGIVAAARRSDLLLLGGGGLFHDHWEVRLEDILAPRFSGLASYVGIPLLARLLDLPCMLYGVGIGPLKTENGTRLTRAAFDLSLQATVRDRASLEALRGIGMAEEMIQERVSLAADPAFSMPAAPAEAARHWLLDQGVGAGEPVVGVCLRSWDLGVEQERWVEHAATALDGYLAAQGGGAILLPFQSRPDSRYEDDVAVARSVAARMTHAGRCRVIDQPLDPAMAAAVLGECTAVLAMRLHAALFALRAAVPIVAMAYDGKVSSLLKEAGIPGAALAPCDWLAPTLLDRLVEASRTPVPAGLKEHEAQARRLAMESARLALSLIGQRRPSASAGEGHLADLVLAVAERAAGLELEVGRLTRQVIELHGKVETLRSQRDEILRERNRFELELEDLRSTLGVRLLDLYWRSMSRLFPEGGRARQAFRLVRGILRHGWRSPWRMPQDMLDHRPGPSGRTPGDAHPSGVQSGVSFLPRPDPRSDLVGFEERVTETGAERVFAIFSTTRLDEDEGQRSTRLALELARRGIPVVFVYWRWPTEAPAPQDRLEDGIVQVPLEVVARHPESLCHSFRGLERVALLEFPCPPLARLLASANASGWITGYDVVDDWREFRRVGQAPWYDSAFERNLILTADFVTAVNERLAERIRAAGRSAVCLIPNGMESGVERIDRVRGLERGEITLGYFGYLSAAWFDWELVAALGRMRPSWRIYLIGYGGGPGRLSLPRNVTLLGRQPHAALGSFAANWDVAIVPFKPGPLAANADPIKTYEYLALGLPVVVTGVYPPRGAEALVARAAGLEEFAAGIEASHSGRGPGAESRRRFAVEATWSRRVDALLALLEQGVDRVAEKRWLARPIPQK